MLPDEKLIRGASIPEIIPPLLLAALASFLLGANTVEIQAIWSLQRLSGRQPFAASRNA